MNMIEENRKRDLWFKGNYGNCYFFPQGWCDEIPNGCPDEDEHELYGYCPTMTFVNSPVETLFAKPSDLLKEGVIEVTEEEARKIHPRLATYLDKINAGEDPDEE